MIYEAAALSSDRCALGPGAALAQRSFSIGGDYVLFVSTIEPRKNVSALLEAFRQVLDN